METVKSWQEGFGRLKAQILSTENFPFLTFWCNGNTSERNRKLSAGKLVETKDEDDFLLFFLFLSPTIYTLLISFHLRLLLFFPPTILYFPFDFELLESLCVNVSAG